MDLPMRVFWHFSGSVERLWAEEDKRRLVIAGAGNQANPEAAETLWAALEKRAPDPYKLSPVAQIQQNAEPEEGAFDKLRRLAG